MLETRGKVVDVMSSVNWRMVMEVGLTFWKGGARKGTLPPPDPRDVAPAFRGGRRWSCTVIP
jgi:hypothetical protein